MERTFDDLQFNSETHQYSIGALVLPSVTQIMRPLTDIVYNGVDNVAMERAADRGTEVHECIEEYLLYDFVDIAEEYKPYVNAFKKFKSDHKVKMIKAEMKHYHPFSFYAGTSDLLCQIDDTPEVWLIDYKTTSVIHDTLTRVQLEAYKQSLEANGYQIHHKGILQLKKDGSYVFHQNYQERDNEAWKVFQSLLTIYDYTIKNGKRGII